MKVLKNLFSIFLTAGLLTTGVSQFSNAIQDPSYSQSINKITELYDEDCYTYERVFIDGKWWIYVYDCDGNLVNVYIEPEE